MLEWLKGRAGSVGAGVYAAMLSLVVLAGAGAVGLALHQPWLFPSLGPTVMLFFESPQMDSSRPRNSLVGHAVGLVAGIGALYVFGLQDAPSAPVGGLTGAYLLAGAVSVAVTTLVLTAIRTPHPPAGATTLIVSLGILTGPSAWASMAGAIVLITVVGWGLNVLLGVRSTVATSKD
ncbi:HPP family protein [Citricoccus sp. GCM10030269]|uniref:HPP family protein n=1 Tax=Citricoccus sp. GCM10030269 TaxID=3273388 RepID=UPI0036062BB4